ncbi:hypothetical protein Tco_1007650 [Tanacetum coccineum]
MRQKDLRTYKINVVMNRPMKNMLKKSEDLWTIGSMGSRVEHIPYFICSKGGSRWPSRKKNSVRENKCHKCQKGTMERPSKQGKGLKKNPEGKEYSHAIRLNFHASEDDMDYEALLVGLAVAVGRQMKDLYMFVTLKLLVDQVEGNKEPKKGRA